MSAVTMTFMNELDNEITITVTLDEETCTVSATGPTSEVEHVWTRTEAHQLAALLFIMLHEQKRCIP